MSLFVVVPKSVEQLSKRLKSKIVDSVTLSKLIDLAIRYWRKDPINSEEWESIVNNSYLPITIFEELYSGLLSLTLSVLRMQETKFVTETVLAELINLGLTGEHANQIVVSKRDGTTGKNIPQFLKIAYTKWSIDVTISTSSVSRVLVPSIVMELSLDSGQKKTLHIPISQFHSLRYQVASCLNKMNQISV